jgi:predicted nucleic acid-binding protein
LILYLDASALVKRYVAEEGSDAVLAAMDPDHKWSMCRIGYVETVRAVALGGEPKDVGRVKRDWSLFDVVEVSHQLAEHAAQLAMSTGLRALDAVHLAAALSLAPRDPTFATWDVRLHRAAREQGFRTLPAELG